MKSNVFGAMNPFEAIGTGRSFLKHFDVLFINHLVSVKKDSQFPFFMHFYIQLFSANPKIQKKTMIYSILLLWPSFPKKAPKLTRK